jgi:hypothetical protein
VSRPRYTLAISFRSNEQPFNTNYDPAPYGPKSDEDAIRWAAGMADQLDNYDVTLLRDGQVLPFQPKAPPNE